MKVAIVGANSQVGTELCVLLRQGGHDVTPIVRNRMGTEFLRYQGFDCAVADMTAPEEATVVLSEQDLTVLAAFASQHSREGFDPRGARQTNKALGRTVVECSRAESSVVHFSSIHAFGPSVGPSRWTWYGREKRATESAVREAAGGTETDGYVFRLGQVFGQNQHKTEKLINPVRDGQCTTVAANPDAPSNVLHTVTLKEALVETHENDLEPGQYTVVNRPQWTWEEVFDYYIDKEVVRFTGESPDDGGGRLLQGLLGPLLGVADDYRPVLQGLQLYLPERLNDRIYYGYLQNQTDGEIRRYRDEVTLESHEFGYDPAPGQQIDGLTQTVSLLRETDISRAPFEAE